ncbi:MAG: peptidylprolyl isomerase [Candidatus Methylacidiphilales bacterium]
MYRIVILVALALVSCAPKDPSHPQFVVAQADGEKVFRSDLNEALEIFIKSQGGSLEQVPAAMRASLEKQILEQLVDGLLLVKEAQKADSKALAEKVESDFSRFQEQIGGEEKLAEMLKELGASEESLKQQIEQSAAASILMEKASAGGTSDAEARAFYDQNPQFWERPEMVQARHILVSVPDKNNAQDRDAGKQKIDAARKRVAGGEDFGQVAQDVSDDPGSKVQGGMLPPFERGRMVPEFEKVAFESKEGALSPVFQTDFGYHFLQVMKKVSAGTMTYPEVEERIKTNLKSQAGNEAVQKIITDLRSAGKVEIFLPEENSNPVQP